MEDIAQLALINSREYQTQKERLYLAALALSLERFDYDLKFATSGNRTLVDYLDHPAAVGRQSKLGIPTVITGEQALATGGTFLATFANRVLLTFNGPNGFTADVGSDLLFDFSQSIFQRDVVLESLTQAERNVVYAARDFARFRKTLFSDLAGQYYSLLLTYRGIEIDTQDYFSSLRGFDQGEAEYRTGRLPRFQVDQFEQSTLTSRRQLISSCNRLEQGLDRLKINIGLPTELPINVDLTELDQLTLRDELMAVAERVRRARRNLMKERGQPSPERGALLNASVDLVRKMLLVERLRQRLGQETSEVAALQLELAQLAAAESQLDVQSKRDAMARQQAPDADGVAAAGFPADDGPGRLPAGAHLAPAPRGGEHQPGCRRAERDPAAGERSAAAVRRAESRPGESRRPPRIGPRAAGPGTRPARLGTHPGIRPNGRGAAGGHGSRRRSSCSGCCLHRPRTPPRRCGRRWPMPTA